MKKIIKYVSILTAGCFFVTLVLLRFFDGDQLKHLQINFSSDSQVNTKETVDFKLIQSVSLDEVEQLNVNAIFGDFDISSSEDENLHIKIDGKLYQKIENAEIEKYIYKEGRVFNLNLSELFKSHEGVAGLVTFSSKGAIGTKALNVKLLVPKLFKKINIETISADFKFLDVGVEELNINNISGDFDMNNLKSQYVKFNTVSGDIDFKDLSIKSAKVDTVSGDIKFQYSKPMDLKAEITSVSGDLSGDDFYKKFINGNTLQVIQGAETQTPPEITINSISGDVEFGRTSNKN